MLRIGEMKQTLPWNVTGIPPEAREAARSAASREGLSVGDWLTRRIYSESRSAPTPPPAEPRYPTEARYTVAETRFAAPEPHIEPPPPYRYDRDSETRRDRDELMHRLARTEAETESAFRRIDETLRGLGRRLESTERSQNEAKLAMHAAATEINAATREQAKSFSHLAERMEHVERHADSGALRDAVRGLHQGLSRLADQIARTATESSGQINALAGNLDTLSEKIVATRSESHRLAGDLEDRLNQLTERLARSEGTEERVQEAMGRLTERLTRSEERVEGTEERIQEAMGRLAERLARSEERVDGAEERVQEAMGRHLTSIERNLEGLAERLDQTERGRGDTDNAYVEAFQSLSSRLEAAEKHSREALSEFRLALQEMNRRIDVVDAGSPSYDAFAPPPAMAAPVAPVVPLATSSFERDETPSFELPPFPEMPSFDDAPPMAELPPFTGDGYRGPRDPFAPPAADIEVSSFATPLDDVRQQKTADDYLSAARRAAQAAAETDPGRKGRLSLASPRASTAQAPETVASKRKPVLAVAAILLLLAGAALYLVSQGLSPVASDTAGTQIAAPLAGDSATPTDLLVLPPVQGPADATAPADPLTTVPSAADQAPPSTATLDQYDLAAPAPTRPLPDTETQTAAIAAPEAAPSTAPTPVVPEVTGAAQEAVSGPALSAPQTAGTGTAPIDRLLSQARAGSPAAALVLGLKYLDGDGVAASDSEGVRWLRIAAEQGEPVAQYRLGSLFERGRGVPADPSQATFWYEQSATNGNRKAMHNLAVAYADGVGVEKNLGEAARWFRAAADLGLTDSQFNLAVLYERGMGVPASLSEAYKWYFIAAQQGDAEARTRVDALATQLPEDQRLAAERAAAGYTPQPIDQAANEPPTIAQIQ